MSKNEKRGYAVLAVLLVVFSVYTFAVPFERTGIFWLAYVAGIVALLFQIYVFKLAFSGDGSAKSKFYGFSVLRVGIIYLAVQMIISMSEMGLAWLLPNWVAVLINVFPIAFAIIGCVVTETMREEINKQDKTLSYDVNNMRALQSVSASLVGQCADDELKKAVQKLADEFKYSDPKSSESILDAENELKVQMEELKNAIIENDSDAAIILCKKISVNLAERNRLCKLGK